MFLKKLVINGFKSFCDYSEVDFVKGISAIVGPNGCGKSNIVDAIKWVIGEQKTKMLRADNMTDVIFKGTETRKGLSRGEVRLTLVNDQNILPIEYNEVEIARIIYTSGENEYYINKQKVRLKDIQELFFDTGVGKSAYSVMEQGKIDLILSTKPEDRRYIVEEAAGITKYKVRREEARNKLTQADENIIRIKDIINEVKKQYENMKIQAEKAEKYKNLYDKEIELEIELNLNRISKLKKSKDELNEELETVQQELKDVKEQAESINDTVQEKMTLLNELENKKIDLQRVVFQVESDIKVFSSRDGLLKEQLINLNTNAKSDIDKIGFIEKKIIEIEEELESIDEQRGEFDEKILSLMKDSDFYTNSINALESELKSNDDYITELKNKINQSNIKVEEKREELKKITDKLVERIESSLNTIDINSDDILKIKNNLNENFKYLIEIFPNKKGFIEDIVKSNFISGDSKELLKLLKEFLEELKKSEANIKNINEDINKYFKITEIFLQDLFSPEGVLHQKRDVEHDIHEIINNIKKYNNEIEKTNIESENKKNKKDEYKELINEIKINLSTIREKKNSIEKEVSRIYSLKNNYQTNKDELNQKIKFNELKIKSLRDEISEIEIKLNEQKELRNNNEKKLRDIDNEIQKENIKVSEQNKYIREINNRLIVKQSQVEKFHIKIAEADTTITNIYEGFYENFSINLTEYESKGGYITNRSYDDVRKDLSEVRATKHTLGNVNLMAIEECKNLSDRFKLLTEQLDDLEKAKKDILKMIEEINKVSEELFIKSFNQIKINFHKIFRKLFDGGSADIILVNPENILETGIDIVAHPPGQKTKSITLLSGGQRTMTAISLMFATFLVKPSPFCLLDEIDAALDEENVTRFINLLNEFKETSQFVMITHNKKTMVAADVMYGVTQEEKGVSKIVSAKFVEKNF
ncbi:MAG TPA: AAA family ATPase [Spirochaetota bacterium]|nr:AAA family ATPase [Spirochaetota bacterium]